MTVPIADPSPNLPKPGWIELISRWIPVLGWIVAHELYKKRFFPLISSIEQQLSQRSPATAELWSDGSRREFALFLCERIQQGMQWPNAYFVPDDSFGALFIDDEGESFEIAEEIEQFLGLPEGVISEANLADMNRMTLGQVVDQLLSRKNAPTIPPT